MHDMHNSHMNDGKIIFKWVFPSIYLETYLQCVYSCAWLLMASIGQEGKPRVDGSGVSFT